MGVRGLFSFLIVCVCVFSANGQQTHFAKVKNLELPYGDDFEQWDDKTDYTKTYYVNNQNPNASDTGPGTYEKPFKTIQKAADVLQPGQKVIIAEGLYREAVMPARGGNNAKSMISYEAAPGAKVVISGAIELKPNDFVPDTIWNYYHLPKDEATGKRPQLYEYTFDWQVLQGYNPFAMVNMLIDRDWLDVKRAKMDAHLRRRGMVFVDGKMLKQLPEQGDFKEDILKEGAFWISHNGKKIYILFPGGGSPNQFKTEAAVKEQVFAPSQLGLPYIKIKGLNITHVANGFPIPQNGALSSSRGHHWIIEDCHISWVNGLGVDIGQTFWYAKRATPLGGHIFRRNTITQCGISGLAAYGARNILVEDNLFEHIGWHDGEHAFESGGLKFHNAQHCLIRRNVFRNIVYAPGIWLDMGNQNCRISQNVFADITTARAGVYIEIGRFKCYIDNNVFYKFKSQYWLSGDYGAGGDAIYCDGSDSIYIFNNFIAEAEGSGYGNYYNEKRVVWGRGGIARYHNVHHNVFYKPGKFAVELPNVHHTMHNNLYANHQGGQLHMRYPEPALKLNLQAWQQSYGLGKNSYENLKLDFEIDIKKLTFKVNKTHKLVAQDKYGPFESLTEGNYFSIDPRKL